MRRGTKKDGGIGAPAPASVLVLQTKLKSNTSVPHAILDVNFLANSGEPEIEAARPRRCPRCGTGAGVAGALRVHGHGSRERTLWGPATADGEPQVVTVLVRRFRCVVCRHVATVRPPVIARYFRYATAVIAVALWLWAGVNLTPSVVRTEVSPLKLRGPTEADRWKSLSRWTSRAATLFGLPGDLYGATAREVATRVTALLIGRAPPDLVERARVFVGAQLG